VTDDRAGLAIKTGKATNQRRIITEVAITMNFKPVGKDVLDVIKRVRTDLMTG